MLNSCKKSIIKNIKIQNWKLVLSGYRFDVEYRPGKLNSAADAQTRNPKAKKIYGQFDSISMRDNLLVYCIGIWVALELRDCSTKLRLEIYRTHWLMLLKYASIVYCIANKNLNSTNQLLGNWFVQNNPLKESLLTRDGHEEARGAIAPQPPIGGGAKWGFALPQIISTRGAEKGIFAAPKAQPWKFSEIWALSPLLFFWLWGFTPPTFSRMSVPAVDFKWPLPKLKTSKNRFMLTIVDEFSHSAWTFPRNLSRKLFATFGTPNTIHSDRG